MNLSQAEFPHLDSSYEYSERMSIVITIQCAYEAAMLFVQMWNFPKQQQSRVMNSSN